MRDATWTGFGAAILLVSILAGCGGPGLSPSERWWRKGPPSARYIAFEQNGKWGYRDPAGRVVIPPRFDYAAHFPGEGDILVTTSKEAVHYTVPAQPLGRVEMNGRWGYVDATGAWVIEPRFERAQDFFENLTAVRVGGKWGFIDRAGTMRIPPRYEEASPFLLGVAHVREDGRWRTIDTSGRDTSAR